MKVIFLDFDGVLNTVGYFRKGKFVNCGRWKLGFDNPHAVNMLQALIDFTGAKVVVSSTWRITSSVEGLQKLMKNNNIDCEVVGKTPYINGIKRGLEIQHWLDENKDLGIEDFIIIDDDSDMEHLIHRLVKCDHHYGFCFPEFLEATKLLGCEDEVRYSNSQNKMDNMDKVLE